MKIIRITIAALTIVLVAITSAFSGKTNTLRYGLISRYLAPNSNYWRFTVVDILGEHEGIDYVCEEGGFACEVEFTAPDGTNVIEISANHVYDVLRTAELSKVRYYGIGKRLTHE